MKKPKLKEKEKRRDKQGLKGELIFLRWKQEILKPHLDRDRFDEIVKF